MEHYLDNYINGENLTADQLKYMHLNLLGRFAYKLKGNENYKEIKGRLTILQKFLNKRYYFHDVSYVLDKTGLTKWQKFKLKFQYLFFFMRCCIMQYSNAELVVKKNEYIPYTRVYKLHNGDEFVVNSIGFENCFGMKIKDINLCDQHFAPNLICVQKIKRKWWKFWKPKYVAVKLRYIERHMEEI